MTVTLTPQSDMSPVPRIELVVEAADVPAGTDLITVMRVADGQEFKVRGGVDRVMASSVSLVDYEAPFGVESVYEAVCSDGGAPLGRVALGSATLTVTSDDPVIQQPLDPSLSLTILNLEGSWPSLTDSSPGELVHTEGATHPTFVGFGPRRAYAGVAIDFGVTTRSQAALLRRTLGTPQQRQLPIWLIRSSGGFLPRVFFARVGELTEVDIDNRFGGGWSRFRATVDEVAPPAPGLVIASLSYDDLDAAYDDYDDRDAAYPSYDAMDRDYSLAGLSG